MYIISCPVMSATQDYCDGRLDQAWDRERDLLDNSDIEEALAESGICPAEIDSAFVALADASHALDRVIEAHGDTMLPRHLAVLRHLAAVAKCASTSVEKVADKIIGERLGVNA